jgi:bla regulator protein BlaR1
MLAWLLYGTVAGLAASGAGVLAERGCRSLGRPVRFVWTWAMAATVALPIVALAARSRAVPGFLVGTGPALRAFGSPWSLVPAGLLSGPADVAIIAAWAALSLVLAANVRLAVWTLRRNERGWRSATVEGRRVAVSSEFGPGVVGAVRPRMVLPEWVLESASPLRRLIALHEVEHVRARDTRLLLGGVMATVLAPWCLPLWWQLRRLRLAVETDCDARVVKVTGQPAAYAHALLEVASRGTGQRALPVPSLAPRRGELERRIRLVTTAGRGRPRLTGLALLAAAGLLALAPVALPAPDLPVHHPDPPRPAPPPATIVILSVTPGGPDG